VMTVVRANSFVGFDGSEQAHAQGCNAEGIGGRTDRSQTGVDREQLRAAHGFRRMTAHRRDGTDSGKVARTLMEARRGLTRPPGYGRSWIEIGSPSSRRSGTALANPRSHTDPVCWSITASSTSADSSVSSPAPGCRSKPSNPLSGRKWPSATARMAGARPSAPWIRDPPKASLTAASRTAATTWMAVGADSPQSCALALTSAMTFSIVSAPHIVSVTAQR